MHLLNYSRLQTGTHHRAARWSQRLGTPVLSLLAALAFASPALAADFYVSPSGNDSSSGSSSSPWRTVNKGATTANSGDTVYVRAGTYNERCINPNSGVTIRAYPGESPVMTASTSGGCNDWPGPIFNINGRTDVTIDGLELSGGFVGGVVIGYNQASDRVTVKNSRIHGVRSDDNAGGVWIHGGTGHRVENTAIWDIDSTKNALAAGVISWGGAHSYSVIGCEMWDVDFGVRDKHGYSGSDATRLIQYNYFHDTHNGFGVGINTTNTSVVDNIFENAEWTNILLGDGSGGFCTPTNVLIARNTHLGSGSIIEGFDSACGPHPRPRTELDNSWQGGSGANSCWVGVNAPCRTGGSGNQAPVVSASASPGSANTGESVSLTASATDVDGTVTSISWNFGDGNTASGSQVSHAYSSAGTFTAQVTATDDDGATTVASAQVVVSSPGGGSGSGSECENWQQNHPEWIWCDDFEANQSLSEKYGSGSINIGSNPSTMTRTTTASAGGDYALKVRWNAGEQDAGNFRRNFGRTPFSASQSNMGVGPYFGTEDFDEIYYRYYTMHPNGFSGWPNKSSRAFIVASGSSQWGPQATIAHLWTESNGSGTLALDPASGVASNGQLATGGWNDYNNFRWFGVTPLNASLQKGQWHSIEVRIKLNTPGQSNGIQEVWLDGQLAAARYDLDWRSTWTGYGINGIQIGSYWNGSGSPVEQERYFDSFVISRERIGAPSGGGGGGNQSPSVNASASPTTVNTGQNVSFSASASDPDGNIASYSWDFGDSSASSSQNPSHSYSQSGTYTARVTVTDNQGATSSDSLQITVNQPITCSLQVSSPSGGANWTIGSTRTLSWSGVNSSGHSNVRIRLYKGGSFVQTIMSETANDGSHSWNIPASLTAGSDYTIQVADKGNVSGCFDYSSTFTLSADMSCTLNITVPNGGDTLTMGSNYPIVWSGSTATGGNVSIVLHDGSTPVQTISSSTPNDGSYTWSVPTNLSVGGNYYLLITDVGDASCYAYSNDPFNIQSQGSSSCTLQMTIPNTLNSWPMGSTQTVTWTGNTTVNPYIGLSLWRNGAQVSTIIGTLLNNGSYEWAIPTNLPAGTGYSIRIREGGEDSCSDFSASFELTAAPAGCALNVTSPTSGTTWQQGSSENITWSGTTGPGGTDLEIRLYQNGSHVSTITGSTPNDGSYNWTIPSNLAPGSNYQIRVAQADDTACQDYQSGNLSINVAPATSTSLNASPGGPQDIGSTITLTAQGQGGSGNYEYKFWMIGPGSGNTWIALQEYSSDNTYAWNTSSNDVGETNFRVWTRAVGSQNPRDVNADRLVTVNAPGAVSPAQDVTLSSSPSGSQSAGATITLTAAASGGTGTYEYKFWMNGPATKGWALAQDYSSSNTWVWQTTAADIGSTNIRVWARSVGSLNPRDVKEDLHISVTSAPAVPLATSVSLAPNAGSPAAQSASITFNAQASGGTGTYEYKFWLYGPGTNYAWVLARDWSQSSSWTWNTSGHSGTSTIRVWARSVGSTTPRDVMNELPYTVNTGNPASSGCGLRMTFPNSGETLVYGATYDIQWTGATASGSNNVQLVWYNNGLFGNYITASTNNDGSFSILIPEGSTASSNYVFRVIDTGDSSCYDDTDMTFTIAPALTCSLRLLSPNDGSDVLMGETTTITWEGVASSGSSNVELALYKNGSLVTTITSSTPNDGSRTWDVPTNLPAGDGYLLRIADPNDPAACSDVSDATFSLIAPVQPPTGFTVSDE